MHALLVGQFEEDNLFHVYNICIYSRQPTENDINSFRHELETNTKFGLTDKIDKMEIHYRIIDEYGNMNDTINRSI